MSEPIDSTQPVRLVTKEQLKAGWITFHPGQIPNTVRHDYVIVEYLPNGHYIVIDPQSK